MVVEARGEYHFLGVGDSLAIEVSGPTIEACLARSIEGLAAQFADVHPSRNGERRRVIVRGPDPSTLLRNLLVESVRLLRAGVLATLLVDCVIDGDGLDATWEVVALDDGPDASRPARSARRLRWHDVCLEPDHIGWTGRAVASR
jgi:SHS2 domain-containing protein